MEQAGWRGEQMCGMMRGIRQSLGEAAVLCCVMKNGNLVGKVLRTCFLHTTVHIPTGQ